MIIVVVRRLFIYSRDMLFREQMPVWLSLLILILGVYGTYQVGPYVNAQFETAKMRSTYILDNLKSLNSDTGLLFALLGKINREMIEKSSLNSSDIEEISQIVTKLQWRAMEYRIIVKGGSSEKIINDYLLALGDLRKSVESIRKVQDVQKVIKCSEKFSEVSSDLLNLIAERSEIRIGDNK